MVLQAWGRAEICRRWTRMGVEQQEQALQPIPHEYQVFLRPRSSTWSRHPPYADRSIGCGVELGAACARLSLVDLGLQYHPRGQPSTVEDKVLFQLSVQQHAKSNADADILWTSLATRFLVAVNVAVELCHSSRRLALEAVKSSCNRPALRVSEVGS